MNTTFQERKIEEQGPTGFWMFDQTLGDSRPVSISYAGRMMPYRRVSGLNTVEQTKVRNGELVVIGGCPPFGGTTWRQVVYRCGRYRTRMPSEALVGAVEGAVGEWEWAKLMETETSFQGDE